MLLSWKPTRRLIIVIGRTLPIAVMNSTHREQRGAGDLPHRRPGAELAVEEIGIVDHVRRQPPGPDDLARLRVPLAERRHDCIRYAT
jgi:hypothetical protein